MSITLLFFNPTENIKSKINLAFNDGRQGSFGLCQLLLNRYIIELEIFYTSLDLSIFTFDSILNKTGGTILRNFHILQQLHGRLFWLKTENLQTGFFV